MINYNLRSMVGLVASALVAFNISCGEDKPIKPPTPKSEVLTYSKQVVTYDELTAIAGSSDKKAAEDLILKGVGGKKDGYVIKSIKLVKTVPDDIVSVVTSGGVYIRVKAIGTVTFDLTLKHGSKRDATIKNCEIVIGKGTAAALTFNKLASVYSSGGKFTKAQIEANATPAGSGYSLKKIETLTPTGIATVSSDGKNLNFTKAGDFTAKLTFGHATKADVIIAVAAFQITKIPVSLAFSAAHLSVKKGGASFTVPTLSGKGTSTGAVTYGIDKTSVATINARTGALTIKAVGTATITASIATTNTHKAGSASYTLEVTDKTAVNLQFNPNSLTVAFDARVTKPTLSGHTVSAGAISYDSSNKAVATVASDGRISIKGIGRTKITATQAATASHAVGKASYTLEVVKSDALNLTFGTLTSVYSSGGKFTKGQIEAKVRPIRSGYTLKSISALDPAGIAAVNGTSLHFTKAGDFTAKLIFEHPTKADATITGADFKITKANAEILTFNKLSKGYIKDGNITAAEIWAKVTGTKDDYTLKEIKNISPAAIAVVDGKNIKMKKVGTFKADLVLAHPNKKDATITGADFEITKATAETLTFNDLSKKYRSGGNFTTAEILDKVQGTKDGYTLKEIKNVSDAALASVRGTKPNLQLDFGSKVGNFTADLVLEHKTKADATITGAVFKITKANAEILAFDKLSKGYIKDSNITTAEILAKVTGTKDDYTLKEIKNISPNDLATVDGKNIKMKKAGAFTADLVLAHPTKKDATITGASFETIPIMVTFDKATGTVTGLKNEYKSVTKLVIPDKIEGVKVTKIGQNAFRGNTTLKEVLISKGIISIGKSAFFSCTSLTSVTLPDGVTLIDDWAFASCKSLSSIDTPNSLIRFGNGAFFGCTGLTSIKMSNNLKKIGTVVFSDCTSLANITIPQSVTSMLAKVFQRCKNLTVKIAQADRKKIVIADSSFEDVKSILIPNAGLAAYQAHSQWRKWKSIMTGY